MKRLAKKAALYKGGPKPKPYHVSVERFNVDPKLARALQPDPGVKIPMFKQSIPEAAGDIARQKTTREALGQMRDIAADTGIPSAVLENPATKAAYSGFAQVRWEKFLDTPAYQTVFKQLKGQAFPQQVVDMLERFMTVSGQPQEINKMLSWTDKTLNLWKAWTLAHPAWTFRNVGQNFVTDRKFDSA